MADNRVNRKTISKKLRFEVFKRDSFKCQYCGESAPEVILHADHINPVFEGGKNELTNLITSCESCNQGKGKRKLSDATAVEKQKLQLDELNERRQQLEMMMKWREGLSDIEETKFGYAKEKWDELAHPYSVNENGTKTLKQLIKKFPLEMVLDAIEISTTQYLEVDSEGKFTNQSVQKSFDYIGKICASKKREQEKPHLKELYYIRGILKNRLSYIDLPQTMQLLERAYDLNASVDSLKELAKNVKNWTMFRETIKEFINEREQK
jgi:hypothetical protein